MFDLTYCLNIDKRYSERERITEAFGAVGIEVNFFLAGKGKIRPKEEYGHIDTKMPPPMEGYPWHARMPSYNAFLCFKKIVTKAKEQGAETLLVLEDDAEPTEDFREVLDISWAQLQKTGVEWGLFYLGANHTWGKTAEVDTHLLRLLGGSQCWHSVCVHRRLFDTIINLPIASPIDDVCARLVQPMVPCFAVWPNISIQKAGFSHCENAVYDYTEYFKNKGC